MINPEDILVGIVSLNDGRLVGRTRLQKTVFLLERCGMESGIPFSYYHYGPYSPELTAAWEMAEAQGLLKMEERPGNFDMPYTVFTTEEPPPHELGNLSSETVGRVLQRVGKYSDVVVELAATLVYLADKYGDSVSDEVKRRKPLKATDKRLAEAENLLMEIGLVDTSANHGAR